MRILDFISDALYDLSDMWGDGCAGKFMTLFSVACLALVAGLCFILCDALASQYSVPFAATVVDRAYEAEHSATGVGSDAKGNVIVTSSHEPEKFKAIVNIEGVVVSATCTPATWALIKKGSTVQCRFARGRFTGWNYGWAVTAIY